MKALELSPVENYARLFPEFRFKEKSLAWLKYSENVNLLGTKLFMLLQWYACKMTSFKQLALAVSWVDVLNKPYSQRIEQKLVQWTYTHKLTIKRFKEDRYKWYRLVSNLKAWYICWKTCGSIVKVHRKLVDGFFGSM